MLKLSVYMGILDSNKLVPALSSDIKVDAVVNHIDSQLQPACICSCFGFFQTD